MHFEKCIFHYFMVIQLVFIRFFRILLYFSYKVDSHKFTIAENMLTHKKCARYTHKKLSAFFVFNNRSPLVFEKSHIKEKNSTTRVVRIKILPTIFNNFPLQKYQGINLILQLPFYGFFCTIHFLPKMYKSYLCSFKFESRIYTAIRSQNEFDKN